VGRRAGGGAVEADARSGQEAVGEGEEARYMKSLVVALVLVAVAFVAGRGDRLAP
jgi:hypothetical protein